MTEIHIVAPGDCLSSIAERHDFNDWRTLYFDAQNADLRARRPDPNVLAVGDRVVVPDRQTKSEAGETGRRHSFVVRRPRASLRVSLGFDVARYRLTVDGAVLGEGPVPASGLVEHPIARSAKSASLLIWLPEQLAEEDAVGWDLHLGFLEPVETLDGLTARLSNLGFLAEEDAETEGEIARAIRRLQHAKSLPITGSADPVTLARLRSAHDER